MTPFSAVAWRAALVRAHLFVILDDMTPMRGLSRDVSLRVSRASVICYARAVCSLLRSSYAVCWRKAGFWRNDGGRPWLHSLGLQQYEDTFRRNAIGADVVPDLKDEHLREMGLPLGHRLKLLKAFAALRASPASLSGPAVPTSESVEGERRQVTVLFADLAG